MRADWAAASEYTNLRAPARRVPWFNISTYGGLHATSFYLKQLHGHLPAKCELGIVQTPRGRVESTSMTSH